VTPSLLLAAGVGLDHTSLVEARLWAQPPTFMINAGLYGGYNGIPQKTEAGWMSTLLQQFVGTDAFVDSVLADTEPGFAAAPAMDQSASRGHLRRALAVKTEGTHLVVLTYRTDRPGHGAIVLDRLISAFAQSAPILHFLAPPPTGSAADQLAAARGAVAYESARLGTPPRVVATAAPPPRVGSPAELREMSEAQTIQYRRLLAALADTPQTDSAGATIPHLQQAIFQVIDPPSAQSSSIAAVLKPFGLGLLATGALEFLVVYLVGLHDPRLRSGEDVENRTGIRYLGSPVAAWPSR
jgi:hypothetical protein